MILCNVRSSAIFLDYSSYLIIWTACLTVFMSDFTAGSGGAKVPWFHATPTNVTFLKGDKAVLQCIVENLGTRTVIWRKQPYGIPISVGKGNFVKIDRFHIHHEETNKEWNLIIKNVQVHDSGVYECQVSSKDKMFRRNVTLTVLDNRPLLPYIMISGNHFVEKGTAIYLTCNASTSDYPAGDVGWFKDGNIINTSGNGRLEIKQDISYKAKTIFSVLTINKATMDDSGTYVCRTSDLLTTRHKVDVLNTRTNNVKREQGSSASNKLMDGRSNCDLVVVYMSSYYFLVPSLLCYIFVRYILLYI